ncbi:hypothetical protein [Hyphobacterium marinum]|uniref:Uncharacterized protein n=1 Tax=Hyphobacterium marinum TaxID=3116574 RepID=A0ABU7LWU1_9PROT|nr:hypothetical protein [Hyphobacterium sp. Y6023]MEE2566023.1 hypothetical protein [Hyphobacterium sp. Y6023]
MFKQIAIAAVIAAGNGSAMAQQSQVILLGDSAMSCSEIIVAATEATEILGGAPEGGVFSSEQAINTATGLAMQGAIHSGIGRAVPGIGAVGGLLGRAARARREEEEARQQVAERRWYYLNGLYEGRMCDDVLRQEAAAQALADSQPPQTEPVSAEAVAVAAETPADTE